MCPIDHYKKFLTQLLFVLPLLFYYSPSSGRPRRNCGQTFCSSCSAKEAPLPAFNIAEPVRVCDACFDALRNPPKCVRRCIGIYKAFGNFPLAFD